MKKVDKAALAFQWLHAVKQAGNALVLTELEKHDGGIVNWLAYHDEGIPDFDEERWCCHWEVFPGNFYQPPEYCEEEARLGTEPSSHDGICLMHTVANEVAIRQDTSDVEMMARGMAEHLAKYHKINPDVALILARQWQDIDIDREDMTKLHENLCDHAYSAIMWEDEGMECRAQ